MQEEEKREECFSGGLWLVDVPRGEGSREKEHSPSRQCLGCRSSSGLVGLAVPAQKVWSQTSST